MHTVRTATSRADAGLRPRTAPLARVAVAVALAVVVLAGCSSDDADSSATGDTSSSTSTTAPPTTTTYRVPVVDRELATTSEPAGEPGLVVYRPADLDAVGGPLPVIAWANGGCVRAEGTWAPLLERWAAAGFVVVALTALPDRPPSLADPTSIDDQAAAIDWAEAQSTTPGSPYEGRLDLDRVVAAGNSCGGITAIGLAGRDDRVAGVFVLSGSSTVPGAPVEQVTEAMAAVHVPVGYVVGAPGEDIAYPQATQDLDLLAAGLGGFVASRDEGDHVTISTTPAILDEAADISLLWLDLVLNASPTARDRLTEDPCATCPDGRWNVVARDLDVLTSRD